MESERRFGRESTHSDEIPLQARQLEAAGTLSFCHNRACAVVGGGPRFRKLCARIHGLTLYRGGPEPYCSRESSHTLIMRFQSVLSGPFRWLVPMLCAVACGGAVLGQTTTITGKVYSPLGPTAGDPIPNILVYVAQSPVLPFATTVGPGVTQGCAAQTNLVSGNPLVSALTDAYGSFTLTSASMPNPATIVIQAGKWRRQYPNTQVNVGGITTLQLTMPANQSEGDLPHIAVVTGAADDIECIFSQIGIDTASEITDPTGTGSINFYQGAGGAGQKVSANTPLESALVSSPSTLANYDVVIFGCQGNPDDLQATAANQQNIVDFANAGGRVFATHYGYVWLDNIQPFESAAIWPAREEIYGGGNSGQIFEATIDQTYPEGAVLANWLVNIGASTTKGTIGLQQVRVDTSGVNNPPAQSWVTLNAASTQGISPNSYPGTPSMQFTFDTPVGQPDVPAVGVTYTNTTTTFLQGGTGNITINIANTSATSTDSTLVLTIALPGGFIATTLTDPTGGWNCSTTHLTCSRTTGLAAGASDPVQLVFSIASTTPVGQSSITASLSGGGISGTNQCGRVLYNDYHVETTSGNVIFPKDCPSGFSAQQKFLEFSLYNLSNFITPSTTDLIVIQGPVTLTWPQPAAILYGTPLSSTQLDATATDSANGTSVAGSFVYTPAAGAVPNAGNDTLSVAFTPTDSTDYASATTSILLEVTPDPTTTTLVVSSTSPTPGVATPIYYGQIIGDTAIEAVTSNGPATVEGGNIFFYIDGQLSCTLPANLGGICPATTGAGYNAGIHTVYSMYSGDTNFEPSKTATYSVTIKPDPTTTTLTTSAGTSPPGQAITFTASVADTYYTPVSGTITFSDGATVLGSVPVNGASTATFTTANLTIGVHSITACFVSAINSSGTQNFNPSCAAPMLETITLPGTVNPTTTLLTSSLNPSVVGESVTFTATTATTGAFISTPSGTVNFFDGTNSIGSGILVNGVATLTTSTLAAGLHNITAAYLGNATTKPSTSVILAQQVNLGIASAGTGFLMSVSPTTFSVGVGSSVSVGVTILELNNFNTPVSLSCIGLPAEATCTFAQSTIPASGGSTPLTVSVAAPHTCGTSTPYFVADSSYRGLPILAGAVLLFFARRRRLLKGLLLAAVLCIVPAISGCGNCTDLGVKPGVYTFTVVGTAGNGAVPVTVAVPSTGNSNVPSTTTQTQTMTMTVTI